MSQDPIVTANLDPDAIARIDALAEERGLTRDEMIIVLVLLGLEAREREPGEGSPPPPEPDEEEKP